MRTNLTFVLDFFFFASSICKNIVLLILGRTKDICERSLHLILSWANVCMCLYVVHWCKLFYLQCWVLFQSFFKHCFCVGLLCVFKTCYYHHQSDTNFWVFKQILTWFQQMPSPCSKSGPNVAHLLVRDFSNC